MLTADHHHSPPRSQSPANGSFLQMPLSLFSSVLRRQNASPTPADQPTAIVRSSDTPDSTITPTKSLMTAGSDVRIISSTPSRPASLISATSSEEKRRRRISRPKTTYNLAQPPPGSKRRVRPKVLLQLHQVVASRRPKPVYEVIPYSILAPVSTRRLSRIFRGRDRLGANDILIVKAEEYGNNDEEKSDDERWGSRDVIGMICPGKEEKSGFVKSEVLMHNGQTWEVTNTASGGYEFSCSDDHGLTLKARWVPKPAHNRRQSAMSNTSQASPSAFVDDRKFTFSTISANSRRHPIIATMCRDRIDIQESYSMPTATSPPTPRLPSSALPTPVVTPVSLDIESFMDDANERPPVQTDDMLRQLIVASGIWVAFCENWSPAYSASRSACPSPLSTSATFRPQPSRTVSMPYVDIPRSASPASTIDEKKRNIPRIIRTGTQLLHRNASFSSSKENSPVPSPTVTTRSRRSNSTGNVDFLGRKASTRKRFGLEDQVLPESEEERQSRRSSELLRIKELTLPSPSSLASPRLTLTPIPSADPPSERSLSPDPRARKTRSAYDPVPTAGLWDSGVVDGPGLKTRPTSMVIVNEKKKKAKKKEQRSKSKGKSKDKKEEGKSKDGPRKSEGFRHFFTHMFRKDKQTA